MLSKIIQSAASGEAELLLFPSVDSYGTQPKVLPREPDGLSKPKEDDQSLAIISALQSQVATLQTQLARVEKDATERGQQQGHAQAQNELAPVLVRLQGAIAEVVGLRAELRRSAEKDLVHLSLAIAKRVLHRELQVDDNALSALVRFAFDRMGKAEKYHIRVHPKFVAAIEQNLPRRHGTAVHVEADPTCEAGTLVIRTDHSAIDASVDSQLEEITRGLVDRIR